MTPESVPMPSACPVSAFGPVTESVPVSVPCPAIELESIAPLLSLKVATQPAQYAALPMVNWQAAAPVADTTCESIAIVFCPDSVASTSFVQPAVMPLSDCTEPL